jgi:hypothetical protein
MLYFRVKPDLDQYPRYKYIAAGQKVKQDGFLIANELYTPGERQKIANAAKYFDRVEVSKKSVYWFFGARFSNDTGVKLPF